MFLIPLVWFTYAYYTNNGVCENVDGMTLYLLLGYSFWIASYTKGATCGVGSVSHTEANEISHNLWWGSYCSAFYFLCCVLDTFICLFRRFSIFATTSLASFRLISINIPSASFALFPTNRSMYLLLDKTFGQVDCLKLRRSSRMEI